MTTRHRPRFDVDALRELAGAKVFARGEGYHRDGVGRMAKLRSRGEHVAYVLEIKQRFGRKRNFMKLLG